MAEKIDGLMANATTGVAAAGVTSAAWLPHLRAASEVAGMLMPILGAIWLTVQIVRAMFFSSKTPKV